MNGQSSKATYGPMTPEDAATYAAEFRETLAQMEIGEKSITALGFLAKWRKDAILAALDRASEGADSAIVAERVSSISDGMPKPKEAR